MCEGRQPARGCNPSATGAATLGARQHAHLSKKRMKAQPLERPSFSRIMKTWVESGGEV